MRAEIDLPDWLVAFVKGYQKDKKGYMGRCLEAMRGCARRDGEMGVVRCAELILRAELPAGEEAPYCDKTASADVYWPPMIVEHTIAAFLQQFVDRAEKQGLKRSVVYVGLGDRRVRVTVEPVAVDGG